MTDDSDVPAAARPYLAERPIRRFRPRSRHLYPLAPGWVRSFMARWHTVARERIMGEVRRHPYHYTGGAGGRAPGSGVRAVGKWPAVATAKSLAEAGHLSTAVVIADLR